MYSNKVVEYYNIVWRRQISDCPDRPAAYLNVAGTRNDIIVIAHLTEFDL